MIKNKFQFFKMSQNLLLGNRIRMWTPKQFLKSRWNKEVVIRYLKVGHPGFTIGTADYVRSILQTSKIKEPVLIFEAPNDSHIYLQGEFLARPEYFLYGSRVQKSMRKALKEKSFFEKNLKAITLINYYSNSNSWDDFCSLIDQYPDHVIEFGIYEHNLGVLPRRNMLIWEVRKY